MHLLLQEFLLHWKIEILKYPQWLKFLLRPQWPELSVNDLKAWFRSKKYVVETLKLLPEMPEAIFIEQAIARMAELGRVNHAVNTG